MEAFFADHGLDKLAILHNNCVFYGNTAVCGTRGWFFEEETGGEHDRKIMLREVGRLETSLKAALDREKLCFLHYPPKYRNYECPAILALLREYGVKLCCYGHIHSKGCNSAFRGEWEGTQYKLISADYLDFIPLKIR
jgi:predicted phosphohydrolase